MHRHDCDVIERPSSCRGCWPRVAADGLRLCWTHHDQIARYALRAGEVYAELLLHLDPDGGSSSAPVSGTRPLGIDLNPRAVEARDRVAAVLASWSKLVVDERGFQPPAASPISTAQFVARNATWLAAHPLAGPCYDELRELAMGEPHRVAFPSGTRVRVIGECPHEGCTGELRVIMRTAQSLLPSEVVCSVDRAHQWPPHQYLALLREIRESVAS